MNNPARLILVGGGHAHLAVLESWIRERPSGLETILVTPEDYTVYSGMVPGWIEGHYTASDFRIKLTQLAQLAGVRLILEKAAALNADARQITLSSGDMLEYDLLSLASGGRANIGSLETLGARLLPVRPMDDFALRWAEIVERVKAEQQPVSIAIVGGGAAGVELAIAAKLGLDKVSAQSNVSLIAPSKSFLASHDSQVQNEAKAALRKHNISHIDARATAQEGIVRLSNGTKLAPDFMICATGSAAPLWLNGSSLDLDDKGFIKISSDLRSTSHDNIFAAGDISAHPNPKVVHSGVHAVMSGPVLAANLRAAYTGRNTRPYKPKYYSLYLLSIGDKRAILSWGPVTLHGRWVWRLKDFIDRRFVTRYAKLANRA